MNMNMQTNIATLVKIPFAKMHGAGNDFVVLDLRKMPAPSPALCAALADRHKGIGCDLILGVDEPQSQGAVASFRIWTADGQPSMQCGNGLRCIAAWARKAGLVDSPQFHLDSPSGPVAVKVRRDDAYAVALAIPDFAPEALPLTGLDQTGPTYALSLAEGVDITFGAVSLGNPHAVIEVPDVAAAPVGRVGPLVQAADALPDSVNVGFVEVCSRDQLKLRVFEFGAGETLACGSGACAAAAYLMRQGRIARDVTVSLPGGDLRISWPDDTKPIVMTGPAAHVLEGEFEHASL